MSIETIEFARSSDIHMLCLLAHTTHVLQPLDLGVFKTFKAFYHKACRKRIAEHPNRVITTEQVAGLVGIAWQHLSISCQALRNVGYILSTQERLLIDNCLLKSSPSPASPDTSSSSVPGTSPDASLVNTLSSPDVTDTSSSVKRSHLCDRDLEFRRKYEEGCDVFTEDYLW